MSSIILSRPSRHDYGEFKSNAASGVKRTLNIEEKMEKVKDVATYPA